jgi:DNA-binding IclR family transcriptional regulator
MKKAKSDYLIQSVSRALDILEAFTPEAGELGVTELSRRLKLHKNNVFRLLATLETRGYVAQDRDTGNYRLGMKTFEVASVFLHHLGVARQARGALEHLARETGETAYLGVLDGPWVICVDAVESAHAVRVVPHVGRPVPAHASALGKAQLAFRSHEELEQLWRQHPPAAATPRTVRDPERLADELARVAATELATEDEEAAPGVRALAVPVRDYAKRVVAAVGIEGPSYRLALDRLETELAPRVRAAAHQVSQRLGYSANGG